MSNLNNYYTYAYLREDGTPYYIGKGKNDRAYRKRKRGINPPKDKSKIIFLKQNLNEGEAFKHEIYMISVFGRKDLGTGILYNRTDGGDGVSGSVVKKETREKQSKSMKGKNHPMYGKFRSDESKRKQSESMKGDKNPFYGKLHTKEIKIKIRESMKGENNPNFGKSPSEETRKKQSKKMKNKYNEKNHPHCGKKWWNDGNGNFKLSIECPGSNWVLGRGN